MDAASLEQLLKGNHRALLMVIDALPFPIYYKDTDGIYLGCNRSFESFVGKPKEEIIGHDVFAFFKDSTAQVFNSSDQELFSRPGVQVFETTFKRDDGSQTYAKFEKATFQDEQGNVAGIIGAIIDISKEKKLEEKLKRIAAYDDLTEIYNRREGRNRLKALCKDAIRKARPLSVLLVDLDNFKSINDNYGHETGDIVLKSAANCFSLNTRQNDIVCRYGGEEFLIILPETDQAQALAIAERYRAALNKLEIQITTADSLQVTASFGVAQLDNDFADRELMLKQADIALYKAKAEGKDCILC